MTDPALSLKKVFAGYGETVVLENVSFDLGRNESVAIIGRNGVGKTTLLSTIMGHTNLHSGTIAANGHDIHRLKAHARARLGVGLVPQEREIFPSLTVAENLEVAVRPGPWTIAQVLRLFPSLERRLGNKGNRLSGGEQQMLAMARALVGNPEVLLLDEPLEGLAPVIVEELLRVLGDLRDTGRLTIALVEQNSRIALDFADRALVMDRGRIVYDGPSQELLRDEERLNGFIGVGH